MHRTVHFRVFAVLLTVYADLLLGCGSGHVQSASSSVSSQIWLPKHGDLRFQGLGAYTYSEQFLGTGMGARSSRSFGSYAGSPLQIGSGVCGPVLTDFITCYWFFSIDGPPTFTTTALYTSGLFTDFETDIAAGMTGSALVTSLDIQPAYNTYAAAEVISSDDQSYRGSHQHVTAAELATTVQSLTAKGSVVTALAPDSDEGFQVFSYSWGGDNTSRYEATVLACQIADVAATFQALTAQGYILTALGGTRASEMRLVGTRLSGQSASRPSLVSVDGKGLTADPLKQGYVTVGFVFDDMLGDTVTRLLQR